MAKKLTETMKAQRLLVQAALDMTRLTKPMRRACMLVLADGKTLTQAARKLKTERQYVYRAVRTVRPKWIEVQKFAEGMK